MDGELDKLVENWTMTLLANLEDPTTKERVKKILSLNHKKPIEAFLKSRKLPNNIDHDFLTALKRH